MTRNGATSGKLEKETRELENSRQYITRQSHRVAVAGTKSSTIIEETTRTEDLQRRTIALQLHSTVGASHSVTTAEISATNAIVQRRIASDRRQTSIELPADIRFDKGAGLLEKWNPDIDPQIEFSELDIRAPLVERIVYSEAEEKGGKNHRILLRETFVGDNLRSVSRLSFDHSGKFLGATQPMFGSNIETDTPQDRRAQITVTNPVQSSLVKSPYRISHSAMNGHMRFTFGIEMDVIFYPPETGEQRVTPIAGGFTLDICSDCGPGLASDAERLTESLQPTFWLQTDHRRLTKIASTVRSADIPDVDKMARLERWARRRMNVIDFAGHFSAAEALERRAGDCTEGAVVLAALGRAAGIPTRVASGIVYSRERYHGVSHAFTPHAWTLAYVDGEWKSFDMSLDGFDATHIALSISDGDPGSIMSGHQLAGLLRWDAMTEVKRRPRNSP